MIEVKAERAKLIGEERWPIVETFINEVTILPLVEGIYSFELVSFKPSGQEIRHNILLVNVRGLTSAMGSLVQETYDVISAGDDAKGASLGRLVIVSNKQRLWE